MGLPYKKPSRFFRDFSDHAMLIENIKGVRIHNTTNQFGIIIKDILTSFRILLVQYI